jgi:RimJ/RimL family protein N-acetyltransferase
VPDRGNHLNTARLTLRGFTADDVDRLLDLDSDPEVMRFLGPPPSRDDYREHPPAGRFVAFETASGAFVGWIALKPTGKGLELGYRLKREYWGRGYATEGSRALIDHAFTDLGAERIYAETMAVNVRSRRVMEKAGLRFVRVFHLTWDDPLPGYEEGEVEYELLREQWSHRRSNGG